MRWGGGGGGGVAGSQPMSRYSCANGAQINFGDLIPYLTPIITTRIEATGKERSFEKIKLITKI
jgi:hypothetical protein